MESQNLRATLVGLGQKIDDLSFRLQMQSWSTTIVPAQQIRNLKKNRLAVFTPLSWTDVLVISENLWNDGVREKIKVGTGAKIVIFDENETVDGILARIIGQKTT